MASASKHLSKKETLSPPPKNPSAAVITTDDKNVHANPKSSDPDADPHPLPPILLPSAQDLSLSGSSHLTRPELLRRRLHYLNQLSRCYKHHYWALMEDLRFQYRQYYWKYGASPFREDEERERREGEDDGVEGSGETKDLNCNSGNGGRAGEDNRQCVFVGCKLKAMALSRFCHMHILSDQRQKLYKPCTHVIKSAQAGPLTCGKPILRTTVPSLCTAHFQMAQKHVTRALKKSGLNVSTSSKLVPKFHVIVTEYVRQIQAKRRTARRTVGSSTVVKTETAD